MYVSLIDLEIRVPDRVEGTETRTPDHRLQRLRIIGAVDEIGGVPAHLFHQAIIGRAG